MSPALDFSHAQPRADGDGHIARVEWLDLGNFSQLIDAAMRGDPCFYSEDGTQGLISIAKYDADPNAWRAFAVKLKAAATGAGFAEDHGGKLLAAVREFASNVVEHSEATESGQIIYAARENRFEFVVRDRGVGVLRSLQNNPKYAELNDCGSAIELALQEGISRHASERGHGYGFRPLFIGLANISEYMRFRSGDHCREFCRNERGEIEACTKQSSFVDGFSCSVICTPQSV